MKNEVIMVGGFLNVFLAFTYVPTLVDENLGGKNVLADEMIVEVNESAPVVTTEESWEGLLTRLFPRRMHIMLKTSIDDGLSYLKKEAERRKNS